MNLKIIYVLVVAAVVTVLLYLVIDRILPARWRKSEVEESEGFTLDSVNVLIGLLFSILLAFVIAGVLSDYDNARSDAQSEANALGAIYGFAHGIPEPTQETWKRDSRDYARLVIEKDVDRDQHPAKRHLCLSTNQRPGTEPAGQVDRQGPGYLRRSAHSS